MGSPPVSSRILQICGLWVTAFLFAFWGLPAAADATLSAPSLQGSYPASPGTSLTPRVYGNYGSIFTSVFGSRGDIGLGLRPAGFGSEEAQISVFGEAGCSGAPVASGTSSDLSGSGIKVTVSPGSTTTFSAIAEVEGQLSPCSNGIAYRQVSDPPAPPTLTESAPNSPAASTTPRLRGTAPAESTVLIYSTSDCSGTPLASGSAQGFEAEGIQVGVSGNSSTTFHARTTWAELLSPCSGSSLTYQQLPAPVSEPTSETPGTGSGGGAAAGGGAVSGSGIGVAPGEPVAPTAPRVRVSPSGRSNDTTPEVGGGAPGAVRVQIYDNAGCSGAAAANVSQAEFAAGVPISVAANAETTFTARSVGAGGRSPCSEAVAYFEDSTPPLTRITMGPAVKTHKRVAIFRFADVAADPPGTSFRCKIDSDPWRACTSPFRAVHLALRKHLFSVRATDLAGNPEPAPRRRHFKVVRH